MNNKLVSLIIFSTLFLPPNFTQAAEKPVLIPFKKTNIIPVVGYSGTAGTNNVVQGKVFGNDSAPDNVGAWSNASAGRAMAGDVASGKYFSNYTTTNILGSRNTAPKVAVSGQTNAYSEIPSGSTLTGTDGSLKIGAAIASIRFIDKKDGTVLDTMTGLKWLKKSNCLGKLGWEPALNAVNALAAGQCNLDDGSGTGDWRIPNILELQSILNYEYGNPVLSDSTGTAKWTSGNPFTGISNEHYLTSTTAATDVNTNYTVDLSSGVVADYTYKGTPVWVWPVKD